MGKDKKREAVNTADTLGMSATVRIIPPYASTSPTLRLVRHHVPFPCRGPIERARSCSPSTDSTPPTTTANIAGAHPEANP